MSLLQTPGGKDEPNIFIMSLLCGDYNGHHNKELRMSNVALLTDNSAC